MHRTPHTRTRPRLAGFLTGFVMAVLYSAPAFASWSVEFIPDEVESVAVMIDDQRWTTWQSSQGHIRLPLPGSWAHSCAIHVYASASPQGRAALIRIWWNEELKQEIDFDFEEDHKIERGCTP